MSELAARKAIEAFSRARRKAFWRQIWATLRGQPNDLLSFEQVREKLHLGGLIYRGVQAVPVGRIIGSVDRYRDFDRVFLPSQNHTAERWRSIGRAFYSDVSLPPVQLYQIGDVYFVFDGNHRISVAREMGVEFIDAEVTECQTRVPVSADLRAEDLEIKGEQAEFLERTNLDHLRPDHQIEFTIAGAYQRLLEHIAVHRHFKGLEWQREVPADEAVIDWYDYIYVPIVEAIRKEKVLDEFPNRTESDLYLWLVDHLHYLREQVGPQIGPEEAAADFTEHHTPKPPLKRALQAAQNLIEDVVEGITSEDEDEDEKRKT
jgi:hypothetical protein